MCDFMHVEWKVDINNPKKIPKMQLKSTCRSRTKALHANNYQEKIKKIILPYIKQTKALLELILRCRAWLGFSFSTAIVMCIN